MMTTESAAPPSASPATRTRPVRVCYVIDELRRAGTELRLQRLIKELPRDLVRPHLCLLNELGDVADPSGLADCPLLELGLRSFRSFRTVSAARRLRHFLRTREIDVVELYYRDALMFGAPIARAAGVRHVVRTAFNLGYWLRPSDHVMNYLARPLINHTITNCESGRRAAVDNFGIRADQATVLANGIDLEPYLRVAPPRLEHCRSPHVGMVANLRPVKGINDFLLAARIVSDQIPSARFSVAGEGESRAELEADIARMNLVENVRLVGRIEDVPGYLATLDVAVLASHSEGLSNALIEYLAAARPVVATSVGGARDVLGNGQFGRLVAPKAADGIAQAILVTIERYPESVSRAVAGREYVAGRYDVSQMTAQFTRFYHSLVFGK